VRFLVFISIVTAILALASFYIGARFIAASPWAASHAGTVWLSLALFVALQFLGPYLYRVFPDHLNRLFILHWVIYVSLGIFGCLLLYSLAADVLVFVSRLVLGAGNADEVAFMAVLAMVLATVLIGFVQAVAGPKVYRIGIELARLPRPFEGFRIVQITDLHLGPMLGVKYTRNVARIANTLDADLVALTGDFVDGARSTLAPAVDPIGGIRSRHGMFFVPGNHEYYWGAESWIAHMRRLGARVLLNEHVAIDREGSALVVAGVTDYTAGHMLPDHASDPERSIRGAPADAVKVLLAHHPQSFRQAAAAGFDLQLSGHTHGGQFFPFSLLVRMTHRYYKGLYRHGALAIYVSRGTGYWGPPLRFGVPAEITLITLRRPALEGKGG
jgi:predicted MPP superfamily phosphohydrolase